jgi:Fungal Zn(2)-Cys(6) binuclear cluster domain
LVSKNSRAPNRLLMNTEISRRSACDRCRGQKLRCVRQSPSRSQAGDEPPLVPCDRCLRAGAACINNIDPPRRRLTGGERIQNNPTSSAPSQDRTPHSLLPKASGTYSTGGSSTRPPTGGDSRRSEGSVRFDDTANVESQKNAFQQSTERPSKRRSLGPSYNQLVFGINNLDPARYPTTFSRPSSINGASSSSSGGNSMALGSLDNGPFNLETSPTSKVNHNFNGDTFDFGMSLTPLPTSHQNSNPASLTETLPPGDGDPKSGHTGLFNANSPPLPPMNSSEDCLHRLSELCSGLLKNVSGYGTNCKTLADVLSYNPRLSNSTTSTLPKNAIGRVLENSQAFLDILGTLRDLLTPQTSDPSSPLNSECSYSDLWDSDEFLPSATDNPNFPEDAMAEALLSTNSIVSAHNTSPDNHQSSLSPPWTASSLDIPSTLTILTCYTWLLHTYDTIFARIHTSLGSKASAIPCILPGLTVGGFNLYEQKGLQVEILMQLSTRMLERIEEMLGISVISAPRHHDPINGLLDAASSSALLDVMFRPKEGQKARTPRVKQTIDDIREALRGSSVK